VALTKRQIDSFTYDGRARDIRYDGKDGVPGFGVRINPGGSKTFILQYRLKGDRTKGVRPLYTIGKYGAWTLQQARQKARKLIVDIDNGIDPKRLSKTQGITLKEFAPVFLADMEARGKATVDEMRRRTEKRLLPALGRKFLTEITRGDVSRLHSQIGRSAKIEANRVVQLLKLLFSRAEKMGYIPEGTPNPCVGVDLFPEHSRTRYLDEEELQRLIAALKAEPAHIQSLLLLYLTTGLRKSELLGLEWPDVHLEHEEGAYLWVGNTKGGRPLRLALSPQAVSLFQEIPTRVYGRFVFPSPVRYNQPLKDFKRYWSRIRERADLPGVTIHDLRRTVGSRLAQAGVPIHHISEVLGHRDSAVTAIYARLSEDNQRAALDKVGSDLEELLGPLQANIVKQ